MTALMLVAGLVLLLAGAEVLIRGAARLAAATGMSPLVIGLTVVAFGTSAPELATSLSAALNGSPDIALGNVVGSNIANVLLILGVSALIAPLVVARQLIWLDVPLMIGASLLVFGFALDGAVERWEGVALAIMAVVYTAFLVRIGRRAVDVSPPATTSGAPGEQVRPLWWRDLLLVLAGLAMLVLGAHWLVASATALAKAMGISELVIGLTVIAVGTSMPEIATSILATLRGEREIAVGNVVGSNVFNLLVVLGLSAAIAPGGVPVSDAALRFDLPVMTAVAIACLPVFFTGHRIARWEGAMFAGYYLAYTAYLLLQTSHHEALPAFSAAMMAFVLPLTVITLCVVSWRAWRAHGHAQSPESP